MNDLASVFLGVFDNESIAYWCFSNFMLLDLHATNGITLNTVEVDSCNSLKTNVAHYFSDTGIGLKLKQLSALLSLTDQELYAHLKGLNMEKLYFCHEWLLVFFKRLFVKKPFLYLDCFEKLSSHFVELNAALISSTIDKGQLNINSIYTFDLFVCLALLMQMRKSILESAEEIDVHTIAQKMTPDLMVNDFKSIFSTAESLFHSYCLKQMPNRMAGESLKKSKKNIYDFFLNILFN
jgi:hypothetical protein